MTGARMLFAGRPQGQSLVSSLAHDINVLAVAGTPKLHQFYVLLSYTQVPKPYLNLPKPTKK